MNQINSQDEPENPKKNWNTLYRMLTIALSVLIIILFYENNTLKSQIKTKNDQLLSQINASTKLRADASKLRELEEEAVILRAKLNELTKQEIQRNIDSVSQEFMDLQQQLVYEKVKLKDISEFHFLRTAEEKRMQIQNQVSIIQEIQKRMQSLSDQLNSLNETLKLYN
ncbi:MAG: hypothetical protein RL263_946 [Bacteroidota bacterium]